MHPRNNARARFGRHQLHKVALLSIGRPIWQRRV